MPAAAPLLFKSPAAEAAYLAAYDGTLRDWPPDLTQRDVPTRFGATHVLTCGPAEAPPLLLLSGLYLSATSWYPNASGAGRSISCACGRYDRRRGLTPCGGHARGP